MFQRLLSIRGPSCVDRLSPSGPLGQNLFFLLMWMSTVIYLHRGNFQQGWNLSVECPIVYLIYPQKPFWKPLKWEFLLQFVRTKWFIQVRIDDTTNKQKKKQKTEIKLFHSHDSFFPPFCFLQRHNISNILLASFTNLFCFCRFPSYFKSF